MSKLSTLDWNSIPRGILHSVAPFLEPHTVGHLLQTSFNLRAALDKSDNLWKRLFVSLYGAETSVVTDRLNSYKQKLMARYLIQQNWKEQKFKIRNFDLSFAVDDWMLRGNQIVTVGKQLFAFDIQQKTKDEATRGTTIDRLVTDVRGARTYVVAWSKNGDEQEDVCTLYKLPNLEVIWEKKALALQPASVRIQAAGDQLLCGLSSSNKLTLVVRNLLDCSWRCQLELKLQLEEEIFMLLWPRLFTTLGTETIVRNLETNTIEGRQKFSAAYMGSLYPQHDRVLIVQENKDKGSASDKFAVCKLSTGEKLGGFAYPHNCFYHRDNGSSFVAVNDESRQALNFWDVRNGSRSQSQCGCLIVPIFCLLQGCQISSTHNKSQRRA